MVSLARKTRDVVTLMIDEGFPIKETTLRFILRKGYVAPKKDSSGDFNWSTQDVAKVRNILKGRRR